MPIERLFIFRRPTESSLPKWGPQKDTLTKKPWKVSYLQNKYCRNASVKSKPIDATEGLLISGRLIERLLNFEYL